MKKLLALILCGAFLALGIAACTPKDGARQTSTTGEPAKTTDAPTAAPTTAPTTAPATTTEGDKYMNKVYATITMENGGVIKLELYPDLAPQSVRNFCYLAR
ncbi:MAG: hypothetical protein IKZ82_07850, partial [Clostridia bacterium]|nr:hypothetical protein [Clostridia bacterium]